MKRPKFLPRHFTLTPVGVALVMVIVAVLAIALTPAILQVTRPARMAMGSKRKPTMRPYIPNRRDPLTFRWPRELRELDSNPWDYAEDDDPHFQPKPSRFGPPKWDAPFGDELALQRGLLKKPRTPLREVVAKSLRALAARVFRHTSPT